MTPTTAKDLACPFCKYELEHQGPGEWECLRCGASVFEGDKMTDPFSGWKECYWEDVRRQPTKKTGGGSNRRRFKKKACKPLPSERYRLE